MLPQNANGESWGAETSNVALQDIRSSVISDLNKRDGQLSRGRLNADNNYAPYREQARADGTGSTFVIDPVLAEIKHTGDEMQNLVRARWGKFCETQQDEKPYVEELVKRTRDARLAAMKAAGEDAEASLAAIPEAEMPVLPPKPKPKKKEPALIG